MFEVYGRGRETRDYRAVMEIPLLAREARSGVPGRSAVLKNDQRYGDTDIVAASLVMLPTDAVTCTVPPVLPATADTTPADTVARDVLLEVQVATGVTSADPLQVDAVAVSDTVVPSLALTEPLVSFNLIDVMHPTVTVTVAVAVTDAF